jgi:hypothetical protein
MSGGLIALSLVAVYLIHTYFFWRSGRKSERASSDEEEEEGHDEGSSWSPMKRPGALGTGA